MKTLKNFLILAFTTLLLGLSACQNQDASNKTIKVGTISGPETALMEVAKQVAKKQYDLNIKIIQFSDYALPNIALNDGSIDANVFQHQPYLDETIAARNFDLVTIGKTFIYPMGIYSKKYQDLDKLPAGSTVGIPNDPSNEARALLLLQKAGLIILKPQVSSNATRLDVITNPKQLKFKELTAAQLPRALDDVDLAVINTNFAVPAGLSPNRDALYKEGSDSLYANIIAVRASDANKPELKALVEALNSKPVLDKAKQLFNGQALPAWDVGTDKLNEKRAN